VALFFQRAATVGGATALPDDGVMDGLARVAVPDDDGLALVGEGEGRDLAGLTLGARQHVEQHGALGLPENFGIVLDPAGVGIELGKLLLFGGMDLQFPVKQDGPRTGRPLIEGKDELRHKDLMGSSMAFHEKPCKGIMSWISAWIGKP